jgi:pimeloyl-ACP methyl ester carboxylesterase
MPSPAHAPDSPTTVTLLFCHGAGFSREIWAPIIARLERSPLLQHHRAAGGHVEMVTFDLPYHGANRDVSVAPVLHLENPDLPRVTHPSMEWPVWMTAAVLRQVEQLQQKSSSMIIGIGHSMGAAAMWNAEALHPGTFAGLVLFEPISLLNSFPGSDVMLSLVVASCLKRRTQW